MKKYHELIYDFTGFMEAERERVKGKMRLVNENFEWLKKGEIIKLLNINISQIYVESLNTGNSGWLWMQDVQVSSNPIEGGV